MTTIRTPQRPGCVTDSTEFNAFTDGSFAMPATSKWYSGAGGGVPIPVVVGSNTGSNTPTPFYGQTGTQSPLAINGRQIFALEGMLGNWDYRAGLNPGEGQRATRLGNGYVINSKLAGGIGNGKINPFGPQDAEFYGYPYYQILNAARRWCSAARPTRASAHRRRRNQRGQFTARQLSARLRHGLHGQHPAAARARCDVPGPSGRLPGAKRAVGKTHCRLTAPVDLGQAGVAQQDRLSRLGQHCRAPGVQVGPAVVFEDS